MLTRRLRNAALTKKTQASNFKLRHDATGALQVTARRSAKREKNAGSICVTDFE